VAVNDLPAVIASVFQALQATDQPEAAAPAAAPVPAVPIRKSVGQDYLICLEDGRKQKTLKRHLATSHHMTPQEYRQRWGLPKDYPMVAPAYAAQRSDLARQIGLGRKPAAPSTPEPAPVAVERSSRRAGGRRKAT
jgi:predicted transcriptional regulator